MVKGKPRDPRPGRTPSGGDQKTEPPIQVPPPPQLPGREATPVPPPVIEPEPDKGDPKAV